jgi:pimeloyl-ACP methyl ester carboxylesterase
VHRAHLQDLRGASRLLVDASVNVTDIVETMHRTIQLWRPPLGQPTEERTRGITGFVYRSVRGGMRLVGEGLDHGLAGLSALLSEPPAESTPGRDAFVALVNGVHGDYLERTGNPLGIEMSLRYHGRRVDPDRPAASLDRDLPAVTGRLLVLVHGLCMNDRQWARAEHDHGAGLSEALGYTPIYVRYNSGRRVHANGRALAELLETLVRKFTPSVEQMVIVGHSMGGLVARSACHHASEAGLTWPARLRKLVFLGTPHHGALLERVGVFLETVMELSPYSDPFTRIAKARSDGINDLCHGSITSGTHDPVPLPEGVECYAAAATRASRRCALGDHLIGDGLVGIDSALGRHRDERHDLAIPKRHQWIGYEMGHLDLLDHPETFDRLRTWLRDERRLGV